MKQSISRKARQGIRKARKADPLHFQVIRDLRPRMPFLLMTFDDSSIQPLQGCGETWAMLTLGATQGY